MIPLTILGSRELSTGKKQKTTDRSQWSRYIFSVLWPVTLSYRLPVSLGGLLSHQLADRTGAFFSK